MRLSATNPDALKGGIGLNDVLIDSGVAGSVRIFAYKQSPMDQHGVVPRSSSVAPAIDITALDAESWSTIYPPARVEGAVLRVDGTPSSPGAYAAVSRRYRLAKGTLVGAAGTVKLGGIVLGLLDSQEAVSYTHLTLPTILLV